MVDVASLPLAARALLAPALALALGCDRPPPAPAPAAPSSPPATAAPLASSPVQAASTAGETLSTKFQARGCDFSATLLADKTSFFQGEPVYLTVRVTTPCETGLSILDGGDYRNQSGRAESYTLAATSAAGASLTPLDAGPQFGGLTGPRPVSDRTPFEKRLLLAHWFDFPAPGRYRVQVSKELEIVDKRSFEDPDKARVKVSLAIEVEVRPPSTEGMGKLIDELGARLLRKDDAAHEAERSLRRIADPRVVRHFAALFEGSNASWQMSAVQGAGPFATDEALEVLKKGTTSPEDPVQITAAQTLSTSPHPGAWALLWSLRSSKNDNVRLTVLHALARRKDPDVEARLKGFTRDPAPLVQGEALRYLAERKHNP